MADQHHDDALPPWALDALRRPAALATAADAEARHAARARVMAAVRRAPHPVAAGRVVLPAPMHAPPRWARRGLLAPGGLALAAACALLALVGVRPPAAAPLGSATVLGDTVTALRDTLRLVRFVLAAPGAARVAVAGDFTAWSEAAIPLARDARTGAWTVTVAVPRDAVRYAFVVDGARRAPGALPGGSS